MDPAVTQSLPQSLIGDVEADDQIKLIQTVQSLSLRESPRKTWTKNKGRRRTCEMLNPNDSANLLIFPFSACKKLTFCGFVGNLSAAVMFFH